MELKELPKQKHTIQFEDKRVVFLLAIGYCLLGGSAFPMIKIGYRLFEISSGDTFSILLFAGIRFFLAGIVTIVVFSLLRKKWQLPTPKGRITISLFGLLRTTLMYTLLYLGLAHTTGVESAIINGTNIVFSVLFSCFLFRQEKLTASKFLAIFLCFFAIVFMNIDSNFQFHFSFGALMVLGSAVVLGLADGLTKKISQEEDTVIISGWQFTVGGLCLIIIGLAFKGKLPTVTFSGLLVLLYLLVVSAVTFVLWGLLLKYNPVSKVVGYKALEPIFGALLSALLLSEISILNWQTAVALIFVCIGVFWLNSARSKTQ